MSSKPSFKQFLKETGYKTGEAKKYSKAYDKILETGLFDENFYTKHYNITDADPLFHYLFYGYKEEYNPSIQFDGNTYRDEYNITENPLIDYINNKDRIKFPTQTITNYERILETNKLFLSNYTFTVKPLVSIIILNRNGLKHLKRLFKNFKTLTNYDNYEIIIIDNNSTDNSIKYLETLPLPIKIIKNKTNLSFSKANNQACEISKGELLLLLNNDMEPTYGWLNELVGTLYYTPNTVAVGAKLLYPFYSDSSDTYKSYHIQHAGDMFTQTIKPSGIFPYNNGKLQPSFEVEYNQKKPINCVTAACLLIKKETYKELHGLNLEYNYGFEDTDLMLELHKKNYQVMYAPAALLFHHESSTRTQDNVKYNQTIKDNTIIFNKRQAEYLKHEILKDKIKNNKTLTLDTLKITILINNLEEKKEYIACLAQTLNNKNYNVDLITIEDEQKTNKDTDIIISFSNNYPLENLTYRENIIKILINNEKNNDYDLIIPPTTKPDDLVEKIIKELI